MACGCWKCIEEYPLFEFYCILKRKTAMESFYCLPIHPVPQATVTYFSYKCHLLYFLSWKCVTNFIEIWSLQMHTIKRFSQKLLSLNLIWYFYTNKKLKGTLRCVWHHQSFIIWRWSWNQEKIIRKIEFASIVRMNDEKS